MMGKAVEMTGKATLHLAFACDARGETIVRVREQQPPWRAVRGFRNSSGETLVHLHNVSGGVLDRDSLCLRVDVGAGAHAQVTTTGATRIYRSRSASQTATQQIEVHVGAGGYLEYLPDQLIPFAGSRFRQTTRVELDPNASLIWWEHIAPGREASGETFCYASLAFGFEIVACGEPVGIERWTLDPRTRPVDSLARLGPFRHFGSAYICRAGAPAAYWRQFEAEMQPICEQHSGPEISWGVTSLRAHGILLRGAATRGRLFEKSWLEIWKAAKWYLCGRVACVPRKVH